jgi:glycosyltransferase involved in cell wall biosynthesis
LFPDAPVFTSFFDESLFGDRLDPRRVHTWPFQGRFARSRFRMLLPFYPAWFAALDLREYDLVVSSSSAFAKAARTSRRALHVAYIYTPMRFAWSYSEYTRTASLPVRLVGRALTAPLRSWDRRTSRGPDRLVAISKTVRERINADWGRDAEIIYPPVDVGDFSAEQPDEGYLLVAARLLAYRRIDLAVDAARLTGRRLIVVGDGPERRDLERRAGPSVHFEGVVSRARLVELFEGCHAYLVPGEEDFGIAPVEAMAAGKPVVAYGRGGVAETVVDGETGVLFVEQSPAAMAAAITRLDGLELDRIRIRRQAEGFSRDRFVAHWRALLESLGIDRRLYRA